MLIHKFFCMCWQLSRERPLSFPPRYTFTLLCSSMRNVWSAGAGNNPSANYFPFIFIHSFAELIFNWISSSLVGLKSMSKTSLGCSHSTALCLKEWARNDRTMNGTVNRNGFIIFCINIHGRSNQN